ncbi:hypothetical protein M8C21_026984 [Ambrosia artemisiifolia]|uniref:Uncharacterized protein n=1 Tax=Ambrosia artemisiifolia TaxID=4212 RepID=A0AAD5GT74_AMBAR|nr:hypothetical protein M8C21_026984 [Ambrosia artemisiifolia]
MTKLKSYGSKDKGKAYESSSNPQTSAAKKRKTMSQSIVIYEEARKQRREGQEEQEFNEQPIRKHGDIPYKVEWTKGPLWKRPQAYQAELFMAKMGPHNIILDSMCFEREVHRDDFNAMGFTEKFRYLGWEALVDFKRNATGKIYVASIMGWLSTLEREEGSNPQGQSNSRDGLGIKLLCSHLLH